MNTRITGPTRRAFPTPSTHSYARRSGYAAEYGQFEAAMDAVASLLADPRARLFSKEAIQVLQDQISQAKGAFSATDGRSLLVDTWAALLAVAEAPSGDQEVAARQRLVLALAEMLCAPSAMRASHRQCYWKLLQACLWMVGSGPGNLEALASIDHRFPLWMRNLYTALRFGRLQPMGAYRETAACDRRRKATEQIDRSQYRPPRNPHVLADEAQYFGNSSDHWRMHTSRR